jgi:hypothetical protein|tara:strand:- start:898 stop:1395 length:498 start_codon:yes stop_codon:yes gene_type:complete
MFDVTQSRKFIEKELTKFQKLNYNQFRWWRWYESKNKPLPNKASFRDKIMNGDYEMGPYGLQAQLCEHMLNDFWDECMPDIQKYNEKTKLLGARRKRLWEDHDKDETDKLDSLYKQFQKNFDISRDELNEEINICMGTILDLYYQVEEKFNKKYVISRRGRPAKK